MHRYVWARPEEECPFAPAPENRSFATRGEPDVDDLSIRRHRLRRSGRLRRQPFSVDQFLRLAANDLADDPVRGVVQRALPNFREILLHQLLRVREGPPGFVPSLKHPVRHRHEQLTAGIAPDLLAICALLEPFDRRFAVTLAVFRHALALIYPGVIA